MRRMTLALCSVAIIAAGFSVGLFGQAEQECLRERERVALPGDQAAVAPLPSPDGRFLAFTAPNYQGIKLLEIGTGKVSTLSDAPGAGFRAHWSDDSRSLAFRTSTGGERPLFLIVVAHPDGVIETASALSRALSLPWWEEATARFWKMGGERPVLQEAGPALEDGAATSVVATTPDGRLWRGRDAKTIQAELVPGKVFYLPQLSPDKKSFVTECLDGHLYYGLVAGGPIEDLGPGSYPSFVRGGKALLFERTTDDGHEITASDIFLLDLETEKVSALTATPNRIERRPAMAGDGHTIFFDEGGKIFKGWVP
jgi:hypothetical protein